MIGKRALYIGTTFFNYQKHIISEFEEQGYKVDYYNDRPSENSFVKGFIKIRRTMLNSLIEKYFCSILEETKLTDYDLVFVVNCKVFTPKMIQQLRNTQKSAKFVLYMWDSLDLYPNSKALIPIFDKAYSFDTEDCERIQELTFLPLFYHKNFEKLGQAIVSKYIYDIVSVCTAHPNRYRIIRPLFAELEAKGICIYSYMFLNKLQYLYNKMFVKEFKNVKASVFKFKSLSEQEYLDILKVSNTVFDIPHNMQSGLTIRTIETLGAKKKIITTNSKIKKYDFYNENNVFVLDKYNIADIEQFLKHEFAPIDEEIYKKYSLHNWIETIATQAVNKYLL
jgi:hypothetical protein